MEEVILFFQYLNIDPSARGSWYEQQAGDAFLCLSFSMPQQRNIITAQVSALLPNCRDKRRKFVTKNFMAITLLT